MCVRHIHEKESELGQNKKTNSERNSPAPLAPGPSGGGKEESDEQRDVVIRGAIPELSARCHDLSLLRKRSPSGGDDRRAFSKIAGAGGRFQEGDQRTRQESEEGGVGWGYGEPQQGEEAEAGNEAEKGAGRQVALSDWTNPANPAEPTGGDDGEEKGLPDIEVGGLEPAGPVAPQCDEAEDAEEVDDVEDTSPEESP